MPLDARVFQLAKDPEHPGECQDAFRLDAERGVAAIADGVANAIFSAHWARVLTEAVVADTPNPADKEAFHEWLCRQRQAWSGRIDTGGLAWFQRAKLPLGAFSTLLWIDVRPRDEVEEGSFGAYRLRGFAIGDSCLFHVRDGELIRTFPIQNSVELEADPIVLGSVDLQRDALMEFTTIDVLCYPGDVLVLCTDAIAAWALRLHESGTPPNWAPYWTMTDDQWQAEIDGLRSQQAMRYDDATLMLLRVTDQSPIVALPGQPAARSEAATSGRIPAIETRPTTPEAPLQQKVADAITKTVSDSVSFLRQYFGQK